MVVSDTNLQATDNTWQCRTVNELTTAARVVYWGRKLFEWVRTVPPVEIP